MSQEYIHNQERIMEIVRLDLLSEEVSKILDDVTERASKTLDIPAAYVSIVLDQAQYFASMFGEDSEWVQNAQGTPVEWSFCQHTVANKETFVVEDAQNHATMKDSPLVTQEGVSCYAGIPLTSSEGHVVGAFCVTGKESRTFGPEELESLKAFAAEAMSRIEERAAKLGSD